MSEEKSKFNKQREEFSEKEKSLTLSVEQLNAKIENLEFERCQIEERVIQLQ